MRFVRWQLISGDCLEVLRAQPSNHFHAMVTDPPAGIAFMGRAWDDDKGGRSQWIAYMQERFSEALRALKPGGHGLVWAIPRTSHWTATALENAGFEVRDVLTHLYGQGFPKSLNVSKAIDKAAGAEREVHKATGPLVRTRSPREMQPGGLRDSGVASEADAMSYITAPATDAAKLWDGWGTALKPAAEHWILVRKPFKGTVAKNVLAHGAGAINIDATRVHGGPSQGGSVSGKTALGQGSGWNKHANRTTKIDRAMPNGRWPANVTLEHHPDCKLLGTVEGKGYAINRFTDGAKPWGDAVGAAYETEKVGETVEKWNCDPECPVRLLDEQAGELTVCGGPKSTTHSDGMFGIGTPGQVYQDSGGPSRFFYTAKPSKREKNEGVGVVFEGVSIPFSGKGNTHPTVKPVKLMEYWIKLICPEDGRVFDPFTGSGTTGVAAMNLGRDFLGIEMEEESERVARARIIHAWQQARPPTQSDEPCASIPDSTPPTARSVTPAQ